MSKIGVSLFWIAGLLLGWSCGSSKPVTQQLPLEPVDDRPHWVQQHPVSSAYYIGIGYAPKLPSIDYQQAAKQRALEDLVSEISVVVSGNSLLYTMERAQNFQEEYLSNIKTSVNAEIADYELVDNYDSEKEYWVYYRLLKSDYDNQLAEREQTARNLALSHLDQAKEYEASADAMGAIDHYVKAMVALKDHLNKSILATLAGEEVYLANAIYTKFQSLLNTIHIESLQNRYEVDSEQRKLINIPLTVNYKGESQDQFPLTVKFIKGSGLVPNQLNSEKGAASLTIRNISGSLPEQAIRVEADAESIAGISNEKIIVDLVKNMRFPGTTVSLDVKQPVLFITGTERNLGNELPDHPLGKTIKSLLAEKGIQLTDNKEVANYVVEIKTDTNPHSETNGFYVCYLTGTIRLITTKTGSEVYNSGPLQIKGVQLSHEKAGLTAYANAREKLEYEVINKLIKVVN